MVRTLTAHRIRFVDDNHVVCFFSSFFGGNDRLFEWKNFYVQCTIQKLYHTVRLTHIHKTQINCVKSARLRLRLVLLTSFLLIANVMLSLSSTTLLLLLYLILIIFCYQLLLHLVPFLCCMNEETLMWFLRKQPRKF